MEKYLIGKDGWMFLGNDNNNTWAQFNGQTLLTSEDLANWRSELAFREKVSQELNVRFCLIIAPNKESIVPEFLPDGYVRSTVTPIDQLSNVIKEFNFFLDLKDPFCSSEKRTKLYYKTDTHWNDLGSLTASREILKFLSNLLDGEALNEERIHARSAEALGDLGNKLVPQITEQNDFLDFVKPRRSRLVYTNKIKNHGRVSIYEGGSDNGICLVVFGDSFSPRISYWLRECASRLVCIHSSSIDLSVLTHEKPDIVVTVNVERFIVRPPQSCMTYSLKNDMRSKAGDTLTDPEEGSTELQLSQHNMFYENMMIEARLKNLLDSQRRSR